MSDEEFLKRWSRRKQEARSAAVSTTEAVPPAATAAEPPVARPEPEIDLSKLPPIDSITAASDITEFLRQGIPAELRHAALRRAWAADPAIRDFVGLAENAWDFTDPNAMPGFGALHDTPEQIGAMVERVIGGMRETAEKLAADLPAREQSPADQEREHAASAIAEAAEPARLAADIGHQPEAIDVASQPKVSNGEHTEATIRRRTHGGAMPS